VIVMRRSKLTPNSVLTHSLHTRALSLNCVSCMFNVNIHLIVTLSLYVCTYNTVKAYIRKGHAYFMLKDLPKCLETYEEGLKIDPDNAELQQGLQQCLAVRHNVLQHTL
jgi:tetratricopeptide (TPR) repeat protein